MTAQPQPGVPPVPATASNGFLSFIRRHPVPAYYFPAFFISWGGLAAILSVGHISLTWAAVAFPIEARLGMLISGSAAVWIGVTLVANGLEGGAALDTLGGTADASAVRALVEGYLLVYYGSIAFAIKAVFVAAAGYATFVTEILPPWTGWLACAATAVCVFSVPVVFAGPLDYSGFLNPGGWGSRGHRELPTAHLVLGRRRRDGLETQDDGAAR
jgi:hypothetical protein